MKFTDGYWLRKENVKAFYAAEAFDIEATEHGLRIVATENPVLSRADTIDVATLILEIESHRKNDIAVTITHFMGYDIHEPRLELNPGNYIPRTSVDEKNWRCIKVKAVKKMEISSLKVMNRILTGRSIYMKRSKNGH